MNRIGFYPVENHKLPGVTTILQTLGFGTGFSDWAVRIGVEKLLQEQRQALKEKRRILKPQAIEIALNARQEVLKVSQIKGLAVHEDVERMISGFPPVNLQFPEVEAARKWLFSQSITPIFQEQFIYDLDVGYAGRLDFYGKLNNEVVLLDFKTTNHHRPEHGLQLIAYAHALEKLGYKVDKMGVLYIKPTGCELIEHRESFDLFRALKVVFDWKLQTEENEWYSRMSETLIKQQLHRLKENIGT